MSVLEKVRSVLASLAARRFIPLEKVTRLFTSPKARRLVHHVHEGTILIHVVIVVGGFVVRGVGSLVG